MRPYLDRPTTEGAPMNTRIIPCPACGGDKGHACPVDIDRRDGSLIERWQRRGRWLTIEDMNGSYVVPASASWEATVERVYEQLGEIEG